MGRTAGPPRPRNLAQLSAPLRVCIPSPVCSTGQSRAGSSTASWRWSLCQALWTKTWWPVSSGCRTSHG